MEDETEGEILEETEKQSLMKHRKNSTRSGRVSGTRRSNHGTGKKRIRVNNCSERTTGGKD